MDREITPTTKYMIKLIEQPTFYDVGTLMEFYQPLIGGVACALYITMFNEVKNNLNLAFISPHSRMLVLTQLSKSDLVLEIKKLESFSLIRTYFKKIKGVVSYTYVLNPPMSHKQLFEDNLFMEILECKLDKNDLDILFDK